MEMAKAVLNAQINKALEDHEVWKIRLQEAIEKGSSEYSVEGLSSSNECDFGKWLYLEIDPVLQKSEAYNEVRELHQSFHLAAANVLKLALLGKKDEARAAFEVGGEYAKLSSELIASMKKWRDTV